MGLRHLDLRSLLLFKTVCSAGSITHGAHEFGLAVGATSRRLAELEKHLGVALLSRSKSGIRPTAAGASLLEHVEKLVAAADQLELSLDDYRMGIETRVRVWANTSAVNGFLPLKMVAFGRKHPTVRIELDEEFSDAIAHAVFEGKAEVGVFAETAAAWGLHTAICDTHRLVVIALPGHPLARRRAVSFQELLDHDFVGLTRGTALQNQITAEAARVDKPLRLRVQVRSYDAVCKIVAAGMGISLVPEQVAMPFASALGLQVIRLKEPWAERRLVAAVRDPGELTSSARAFFDSLTERP